MNNLVHRFVDKCQFHQYIAGGGVSMLQRMRVLTFTSFCQIALKS